MEDNTKSITIDWMSQNRDSTITLIGPGQQTYSNTETYVDEEMFEGAIHHQLEVKDPTAGKWKVKVKQSKKESYLMQVAYESELNQDIQLDTSSTKEVKLSIDENSVNENSVNGDIIIQYSKNGKTKQKKISQMKFNSLKSFPIKNAGKGVYHIMLDVNGNTKKGALFERTILHTIYIDENGKVYQP